MTWRCSMPARRASSSTPRRSLPRPTRSSPPTITLMTCSMPSLQRCDFAGIKKNHSAQPIPGCAVIPAYSVYLILFRYFVLLIFECILLLSYYYFHILVFAISFSYYCFHSIIYLIQIPYNI